ncbi:MAG: amidohydrolase [Acidobacteria bacterium]|nr:MAG: amidohydrolase [Acidobacteriota bacterium]
MSDWRRALVIGCLFSLGAASAAVPKPKSAPADTIIVHGKVYTVNAQKPWAEALAIRGDKIVAVGSNREIERFRGRGTRVIDARGHLVLPGFTDCHIHFLSGSLALGQVNLEGARTVAEIQQRVKDYAASHPGRGWILGRGWTYPVFGQAALPHKKFLDEILADRPALLEGFDGHTYWANSRALAKAGITRDTPDPPNGQIVRDSETGEPTGALKEAASELIERVVPKPTRAEKLAALQQGIAEANRNGLVRVHSAGGDFEEFELYDELRGGGALTVRMYIAYFLNPPALKPETIETIEEARRRFNDEWLSAGAVKTMLDGVVESHTAAMLAPYADDRSVSGKMFWEADKYKQSVAELNRRGFQIFTHAIGDAAVRLALDAYEQAPQANGSRDARPRIEHIETISSADISRFGRLGVIASFQPLHAYPDEDTLNVWVRNVGPERETRAFAWRSVASGGGRLAFGSDWPVVTLNPWAGLQNAVTRQDVQGLPPGGWVPEQRLRMAEAIEAYTLGAAIAGRREKTEGSIEPGKLADLVIVSQNLFEIDPHAVRRTTVLLTMVGGKTVYQASCWASRGAAQPEATR